MKYRKIKKINIIFYAMPLRVTCSYIVYTTLMTMCKVFFYGEHDMLMTKVPLLLQCTHIFFLFRKLNSTKYKCRLDYTFILINKL